MSRQSGADDGYDEGLGYARRELWYRLIRRSFGVPDLIQDATATEYLRSCFSGIEVPRINRSHPGQDYDEWFSIIDDVIEKVRALGETGRLDEFLLRMKDHDLEKMVEAVVSVVPLHDAVDPLEFHERLSELARSVLERLQKFVDRHPFTDKVGHYFGADWVAETRLKRDPSGFNPVHVRRSGGRRASD